jgi:hypothetical protein
VSQRTFPLKLVAAVVGYALGAGLWLAIVHITGTAEARHWLSWNEYPQGTRTAAFYLAGPLGALAGLALVSRGLEAVRLDKDAEGK